MNSVDGNSVYYLLMVRIQLLNSGSDSDPGEEVDDVLSSRYGNKTRVR